MISLLLVSLPVFSQEIVSVKQIGQLTGQPSINNTGNVNVYGTDLGSMFLHNDGKIYFLFGDTFGTPGPPASSGDWRSNVMAFSSDTVASDGITFDGWITDGLGQAKALVDGNHQPNDGSGEVTKIPTAGWSFDGRQFMWFMSIKQWGDPGKWDVNHAEIAYSDDNGNTWHLSGTRREANSNFIQVTIAEQNEYLLFWGIPAGRFGGVKLARVLPSEVLDNSAYQYFTGDDWSSNEADGATIVEAPVGELSVLWNPFLQRWIMMYLNESKGCIELREAELPEGPWSEPVTVVCSNNYPALYGAYMHPRYIENDGETVYFLMSQYGSYNVFLMAVTFRRNISGGFDEFLSKNPLSYTLHQNYPNPFNAQTRITFELSQTEWIRLQIFNTNGQQVRELLNKNTTAGHHAVIWDGNDDKNQPLGSGLYFYRFTAGKFVETGKAVLLK